MNDELSPVARIRLARSVRRLLLLPAMTGLAGVASGLAGWVTGGPAAVPLAVAGAAIVLLSLAGAAVLLSVRLDVELATLRLHWLGGERQYELVRGPVTRVALRGANASRLRASFGILGWAIGPARLRGEESIEVIRLAPTRTVILVPTDRGRLAIAPVSEEGLLDALAAAARVQQRLDEMTGRASAEPLRVARPSEETYASFPAQRAEPPPVRARQPVLEPPPRQPRLLTGIERALLEERLAAERAAAEVTAEAERRAAAEAATPPEAPVVAEPTAPSAAAPPAPAPPVPEPVAGPAPAGRRGRERARWQRPDWVTHRPAWFGAVLPVVPLVMATAVVGWLAVDGQLRVATTFDRTLLMGLALAGPITTAAVVLARRWWPPLAGPVLVSAACALILLARVALG